MPWGGNIKYLKRYVWVSSINRAPSPKTGAFVSTFLCIMVWFGQEGTLAPRSTVKLSSVKLSFWKNEMHGAASARGAAIVCA